MQKLIEKEYGFKKEYKGIKRIKRKRIWFRKRNISSAKCFFCVDLIQISGRENTSVKISDPKYPQPETNQVTLILDVLFFFVFFSEK